VGFGGECGSSRAARADGAVVWVWNRRSEQLARTEHDWAAHATAFGTAGAAKWVNRHEYCLTQPRATISINIPTGPSGRPAAEAAERRSGAPPQLKFLWHGGQAGLLVTSTARPDPTDPTDPLWGRGSPPPGKKNHIIAGKAE
jgi:hypothetical protein